MTLREAALHVVRIVGLTAGFAFLLVTGVYGYLIFFQERVHATWEFWKNLFHLVNMT
jgi:hypothetical protein